MIELANKIVSVIQSGNILWMAVLIVVAFMMNLSKVLEFLESRKKTQIKRLLEAMNCEYLDSNFKEFLTHEIQREFFLYVSKIAAEKQFREKLFEIHRNANGNLPFFHFRRASSYLNYYDDELSIEISKYDIFSHYINIAFAILLCFIGIATFMIPVFVKPFTIIQALWLYGYGVFFMALAMFFWFQAVPLFSAKLIRKELIKLNNTAIHRTDNNASAD